MGSMGSGVIGVRSRTWLVMDTFSRVRLLMFPTRAESRENRFTHPLAKSDIIFDHLLKRLSAIPAYNGAQVHSRWWPARRTFSSWWLIPCSKPAPYQYQDRIQNGYLMILVDVDGSLPLYCSCANGGCFSGYFVRHKKTEGTADTLVRPTILLG